MDYQNIQDKECDDLADMMDPRSSVGNGNIRDSICIANALEVNDNLQDGIDEPEERWYDHTQNEQDLRVNINMKLSAHKNENLCNSVSNKRTMGKMIGLGSYNDQDIKKQVLK